MRTMKMPGELTVISPSEFMAKRLSEDGIRVDHVLRNFVPDIGLEAPGRGASRIVYLGILERHKGVMTLLEAFNSSKDSQGFELDVFGEGSLRPELEKRIALLGLNGRSRIHGFVPLEETKDTLREAAAVVLPSESYENAPLVAMEALSMGIPVIGSNIGGIPEILRPESGSRTYPPGDSERLAAEIVKSWKEREALPEWSARARAEYVASFSPETHIRKYMEILDKPTT